MLTSLRVYYQPHALQNDASSADYYNGLAQKFSAAADLVNPETPAEQMVDETEKTRRAWTTSEQLGHRLTATLAGLSAAASLAGVNGSAPEVLLALCVDASNCHRRRTWEAFNTTTGRTGRWGALHKLGATIRAHDLVDFAPYQQPPAMEVRQHRVGLGIQQRDHDPADDEYDEIQAAVAAT